MTMTAAGIPVRHIAGGRELRKYNNGYWYIRLTDAEFEEWVGTHWSRYVTFHKWKIWMHYGEYYTEDEARYKYLDGDQDNIRITNIGIRLRNGTWV